LDFPRTPATIVNFLPTFVRSITYIEIFVQVTSMTSCLLLCLPLLPWFDRHMRGFSLYYARLAASICLPLSATGSLDICMFFGF